MEECLESPGRAGCGQLIRWDRQLDWHFPTSTLTGPPETSVKHKIDKRITPHYLHDAGEAQPQTTAKYDTNTEQKDMVHPWGGDSFSLSFCRNPRAKALH